MTQTKEEKRAYNREYYQRNREKLRERETRRYHENKESIRERRAEFYLANREEILKRQREWYWKNRDHVCAREIQRWRERRRFSQYGITRDKYDELLVEQGGVCAICSQECNVAGSLSIDHDHETKNVRGLLCKRCNSGLGFFRESPAVLRQALDYLLEYL